MGSPAPVCYVQWDEALAQESLALWNYQANPDAEVYPAVSVRNRRRHYGLVYTEKVYQHRKHPLDGQSYASKAALLMEKGIH